MPHRASILIFRRVLPGFRTKGVDVSNAAFDPNRVICTSFVGINYGRKPANPDETHAEQRGNKQTPHRKAHWVGIQTQALLSARYRCYHCADTQFKARTKWTRPEHLDGRCLILLVQHADAKTTHTRNTRALRKIRGQCTVGVDRLARNLTNRDDGMPAVVLSAWEINGRLCWKTYFHTFLHIAMNENLQFYISSTENKPGGIAFGSPLVLQKQLFILFNSLWRLKK